MVTDVAAGLAGQRDEVACRLGRRHTAQVGDIRTGAPGPADHGVEGGDTYATYAQGQPHGTRVARGAPVVIVDVGEVAVHLLSAVPSPTVPLDDVAAVAPDVGPGGIHEPDVAIGCG